MTGDSLGSNGFLDYTTIKYGADSVEELQFLRGDIDQDGREGAVAEALVFLLFNFSGGRRPPCLAAADTNGDGDVRGVTDAVYLLNFSFLGGPAPHPPILDCGATDLPSDRVLGCETPADDCP